MAKRQVDEEIKNAIDGVKNGRHELFEVIRLTYAPLVESMVQSFEKSGAGNSGDLTEEAVRALLKAVLSYDVDNQEVTFGLYAKICMRNALISARRSKLSRERRENRKKAQFMPEEAKSIQANRFFEGLDKDAIMHKMHSVLSSYEYRVLDQYSRGKTAAQIAKELGREEKSVNNALYRIRSKARKLRSY